MRKQFSTPKQVEEMAKRFTEAGGQFFVVGGAVRDWVMGRECKDFDCMVADMPMVDFERVCHECGPVAESTVPDAMVHVVHVDGVGEVEVSFAAVEVSAGVFKPATAKEDAFRRDVTINAMFFQFVEGSWEFVDFCGGFQDAQDGVMRVCSADWGRSADRVDRMPWQISMMDMEPDPRAIEMSKQISPDEVKDEQHWGQGFWKWSSRSVRPSRGWKFWMDCGWAFDERFPAHMMFGVDDQAVMDAVDQAVVGVADGHDKAVRVFAAVRDVVGDEVVAQFFQGCAGVPKSFAHAVWQFGKPDFRAFKRDVGRAVMASQPDRRPGQWVSQAVSQAWDAVVAGDVDVSDAAEFAVASVE